MLGHCVPTEEKKRKMTELQPLTEKESSEQLTPSAAAPPCSCPLSLREGLQPAPAITWRQLRHNAKVCTLSRDEKSISVPMLRALANVVITDMVN